MFIKISYVFLIAFSSLTWIIAFDNENDMANQVSILACAAIAKKMIEVPSSAEKFSDLVLLFSERIQYEPEQTKNFVNLLILNNCFKKIDVEQAGDIIKERAETKDVNEKWIDLLSLDDSFNQYSALDVEEKKNLFGELAEIKEHLRGLSDSLGDIQKGDFSKISNNAAAAAKASKNKENNKKKKDNENPSDTAQTPGFFSVLFNIFQFFILYFVKIVLDNIYILALALLLALLVSLLGKKRLRKKTKKTDKNE